ncbi:hypothetical protein [Sphingomonas montanisoli]|nr:hypothetical protein [Sphingomonas montanisoli]
MIGGQSVDLGARGQRFLQGALSDGGTAMPTGALTYGRPVATLDVGGQDYGRSILDQGLAVATPNYLKADPSRLLSYMEAERGARLNRRGAFAGQFQMPSDYRHKLPWAPAEEATDGKGVAFFKDEATPFQGLRPEIAKGYADLFASPTSTADDLVAYAKVNGFQISADDARKRVEARNRGAKATPDILYNQAPRVLTDAGDGVIGAVARGAGDPVNLLDEVGGVIDTLGGTRGRENIWSSDRRFGDILYNNIDQNRSVLAFDDDRHPYARFGGQLASGLAIPGGAVEGLGLNVARLALRSGASRFAATAAARSAVRNRLLATGAIEGGVAGFGSAEGGPLDRVPSTIGGAAIGAGAGLTLGVTAPYVLARLRGARQTFRRPPGIRNITPRAPDPDLPPGFQTEGHPPIRSSTSVADSAGAHDLTPDGAAFVNSRRAAMASDVPPGFTIEGPAVPSDAPDLPPGFEWERPVTGKVRPIGEPSSAEDMANLARTVDPRDVMPLPANAIESLDEAERALPGTIQNIQSPDERDTLPRFTLPDGRTRRQPLDLVGWLRTRGGVKDDGGNLRAMGIDNSPRRDLDFAKDEGFLGRLVNPDGMQLDEAAARAAEAGFFPDHPDGPSVNDLLDAIDNTHRGTRRTWRPDDLETLDTYNATRDQRMAVEQAEAEGRPLAQDIGQPVTMADLDANSAPATAYEDLPAIGARAGNIALDKLESSEDIRRALQSVEAKVGGFDAARRGKISHAETAALARDIGMTADDLLKRRQGQALNAEQALAARAILAKSGDELLRLADKVETGGPEAMAAFREGWLKHVAIQEQVSGATAEAGRALSQFRMTAKAKDARGRVLKALVDEAGGEDRLTDVARRILDLRDPAKVNRFLRDAAKPRLRDKLTELYMNSLLSGPQTHAVNVLSNTLTALGQIPEHGVAAAIGRVRSILPNADADRVLGSEVGARAVGLLQGFKEGLGQAARTLRTGEPSDFMSKVEAQSMEAISGLKGKVIRTPTRALSAEDELFKAMARRMELWGLATRKANTEGLKGDALKRRVADLASNPDDKMLEEAFDYGRYLTFQRPLGPIGQSISRMTTDQPLLKLVVPFVRTPTNILKFALERSPGAPLIKEWRADIAAGGARRDLAIAKTMIGTSASLMAFELAGSGTITGGGPADESAERLMRADGWQPYSIRVGDRYYSYSRLDPYSTTLGIAADVVDLQSHMTDDQREKVLALMFASVAQNLSSKTWLSGVADLTKMVDDPGRYAGSWLQRTAGGIAVPALVAQTARSIDPYQREARSILDTIRARIPGLSQGVEPRRDVWGQPVRNSGGLGPDMVSPIWTSTARKDLINGAMLGADAHVGQPRDEVYGRKLSPSEYGVYREQVGLDARGQLGPLLGTPGWTGLPAYSRQEAIEDALARSRRATRERIFGKPPKSKGVTLKGALPPLPDGFMLAPQRSRVP